MKNLTFVQGNVAAPQTTGPLIIAHLCNDVGIWSGSVARQIARRWPDAERAFHRWYRNRTKNDFGLGAVQFVKAYRTHVNRVTRVANMVAVRGCSEVEPRLNRYQKLAWCLAAVGKKAWSLNATVHLPKFRHGETTKASKSQWRDIEALIRCALCDIGVGVFIYEAAPDHRDQLFAKVIKKRTQRERSDQHWKLP